MSCLWGGLALLFASMPLWAGPMATSGQFDVSPSGAATYTIPIAVPPGTAGLEPKLALAYNSQTGNGLLGVGWSLSGLSAITRCPRTMAQDGVRGGVNYDANDRFCLDGQRLMVVAGSYGADGAEYRTERESYSKIVSYGTAGAGPAWFKVWTKAGQILEYGATANARIEAQGKTSVRVWAMNKLSDTKGNYLTVDYTKDAANGDYVPARIDYTGNANTGLAANNSVQFIYEARPDSVPMYFQGSLLKSLQRLTKLQTVSGATATREYRLTYGSGATGRSRIASITECALPDNLCKPAIVPTWTEYGSNTLNAGATWTSLATGFLADVDGDGRADFIAQQSDGLYVALSTGATAGTSSRWIASFSSQGYSDPNVTPIFLADVNADGLADAVGFANDGVYVALSNGAGFNAATRWLADFGTGNGWPNMDTHPRFLADVNGDGRPDIVGFAASGTYVSINTGAAFSDAVRWTTDFGTASAIPYANAATYPRIVADMNGDGLADIVGFAAAGTYVALNTGTGFAPATLWLADLGVNAGYTTQDGYPRMLADVNGDGLPDIVGFKNDGAYVAINTGTGLQPASKWIVDFGTSTATAYSSQKGFPRYAVDMNGDGRADIVGFAANGVQVALSTGAGFQASSQWVAGFGSAAGYGTGNPRQLADLDGDGFPDIVGTLSSTSVATSGRNVHPDLIAAFPNGLGTAVTLSYDPLTKPAIYTRGSGSVYPQLDLTIPQYVVSFARLPNALGSGYTMNYYQYGSLKADLTGRGLLGFGWQQVLQVDSNLTVRTGYRQDWPYTGLPAEIVKSLPGAGNGGLLNLVVNTYACLNPQTGAACTVAAGSRYFPYVLQTVEAGWDVNGATLPVVATNNAFDSHGNATQVVVATDDGFTKTTTNTYTNDTANWFLGRLVRSQVASSATGAPVPNMANGEFVFNATISSDTANYNLRSAAIAAGWDGTVPLVATVTINAGVKVYASATTTPAFDTGSSFPPGSSLRLVNNGSIIGKGGRGGQGYGAGLFCSYYGGCSTGTDGQTGGPALTAAFPLTVTNNGSIAGGGGGGGGGGYAYNNYYFQNYAASGGGGGGGGAGQGEAGPAGIVQNGYYSEVNGNPGNPGTMSAGGAGGTGNVSYNNQGSSPSDYALGGTGGTGGAPGQPGSAGANGRAQYIGGATAGGAAGPAVTNNSNITWLATGTRLGSLVAGSADAPLALTAVSPNVGPVAGGTLVTLTGTGFTPGASATIGGVPMIGCSVNSSTRMSCVTPAGSAGAKSLVVTSGGASATLANGFTYQALTVTGVSPNVGSFAGGATVTITGTGFGPGATASFGSAQATGCVVNGSTSMTCTLPANSAGVKDVTVGLDETSATLAGGFTYQGLSLTAISPNTGNTDGGTSITLSGTGFAAGATVTIGGTAATACSVASATSMNCTTPPGSAGAKDVVVSLSGSTATLAGGFNYVAAFSFNQTLSGNTANYNLRAAAIAAGWNQTVPVYATVTVNAGVYIWSDSISLPAMDTGALPAGSTLTLVNNGYIMGKGGAGGGRDMPNGGNGQPGGHAINLTVTATITSGAGYILGGGGGGGGGGDGGPFWLAGGGGGAGGGAGGTGWTISGGYYAVGGAGGGLGVSGAVGAAYGSNGCGDGAGNAAGGGGGGKAVPSATTAGPGPVYINFYWPNSAYGGLGGSGGGAGAAVGCTGATGGSGGGAGATGGDGSSGNGRAGGGGGGWGAAGGAGFGSSGGAAGKAINTNGKMVTWTGGFPSSRVYGAVN